MIHISYYQSPFGELILGEYNNQLCLCDWNHRKMRKQIDTRIQKQLKAGYNILETPFLTDTKKQLDEYFSTKRTEFSIPLLLVGTTFQQKVWNELLKIPYGETKSYLSLSRDLGNEKAIRAVASANGANSISILIPCHRIIGKNGELTGYAGGLNTKKNLLIFENSIKEDNQLTLF